MERKYYIVIIFILGVGLTTDTALIAGSHEYDNQLKVDTKAVCTVMSNMPPRPRAEIIKLCSPEMKNIKVGDYPAYFSWIDYNDQDWTTPVRHQGSCGSCWAFAAISMIESKINIVNNDPDLDVDLSEQYVLSCLSSAGTCNGGWTPSALYYIKDESAFGNYVNGVVTEECFNYQASDEVPCSDKCSDWMEKIWPIYDYGTYYTSNNRDLIKQTLIEKGPVGVHFYASNDFISWGNSHHSPYDYYPYAGASYVNHAVLLVGYKDDPSIPNGGYWILKNSWGTSFGYGGFFNLEYKALKVEDEIFWVDLAETENLIVDFEYNPTAVTTQDHVIFQGSANLNVTSWWWAFGDGYYSDLENPKHQYYTPGTYTINLSAETATGKKGSKTKIVEVTTNEIQADFDYTPKNVHTDDTIQFTDESIGNLIEVWYWEFGDGSISYLQNPSHKFDDNGYYQVTLTVYGGPNVDSISKFINVKNIEPFADFSYTKYDNTVSFTDLSYDPDGTILSYNWNFGDGQSSTEQNPTHIYTESGTYIVSLSVIDNDGGQDELLEMITVKFGPEAAFSYTPLNPLTTDIIQFIDNSINATSWLWDFNDGTNSSLQNPIHQYTQPGIYDVKLTVFDLKGYTNIITKAINVLTPNNPPNAEFIYSPLDPTTADEISFDDTSTDTDGTIESWLWDFGDGNTSYNENPTHKFSISSTFNVSLTVTDDRGDSDTYSILIFVDISPEYLDIEQTQRCYPPAEIYDTYQGAQSFIPHVSKITRIQLYLERDDDNDVLSGDLKMSIDTDLESNSIVTKTISLSSVPKSKTWIEFDITDTDVTPGDTYYIVLSSNSRSSNQYITWEKGKWVSYSDGAYYTSKNGGGSWRHYYSYDFCFRVYGIS